MLLTASDTAMYEKMDRRETSRKLFTGGIVAMLISLLLWGFAVLDILGIYYALLSAAVMTVSLLEHWKLKREIMPLTDCFIRLEENFISVFQPKGCGNYEGCTIYYREIKKVMPGRRYGIPCFFIILQENALHSGIQDLEISDRTIFCVKGEGYDRKAFVGKPPHPSMPAIQVLVRMDAHPPGFRLRIFTSAQSRFSAYA